MKNSIITIVSGILLLSACRENQKKEQREDIHGKAATEIVEEKNIDTLKANFSIEILDNEALQVIDPKANLEILASGFTWTEGPLWVEEGNYLLFSDIPNNKVYKLDNTLEPTTYLEPSGYTGEGTYGDEPGSNGLVLNKQGELILLQHGDRSVAKMNAPLNNPKAEFRTLVDSYHGKKLNSPNDGFFDKAGNFYFTDPPYGLPLKMDDPHKELDFQGVFCLLHSGELVLVDSLSKPNGIAQSPDGSTLYVAVSDPLHAVWYQYDIEKPGKVSNKRVLYDVTHLVGQQGEQGLPDGLKTNSKGYLFATGPGGMWIFNSSAKVIARIHTGQLTSNCAFTTDEKRVFLTADDYILAIDLL
ncbi:SMP-30/gluconolactonase/LRE family protein [Maribacter sp. ACAM166]|uniref:SMP-30/gluconolactonase/LRE family protein n=1 Tax=Maribacter sp. ACAM166 TaxID=2508996 RepID=UPI0010FEC345|nr:SMP-30/gluconolactonase/LRE family protein [Maribacter sp. ACAM166]TLP70511.1 SMP-30/gluconolactonase/LRE family protein [Maribacter sp. ACAM166]